MERTTKYTLLISALLVSAVGVLTVSRYMTASEPVAAAEAPEKEPSEEELSAIVEEVSAPDEGEVEETTEIAE